MTNNDHLLVTPEADESLSYMIRYLGSRYVQYVRTMSTVIAARYRKGVISPG